MYKVIIDIGDWSWDEEQKLTIETSDFDKVQIIQEFIAFQQEHGWAADYDLVEDYEEEEEVEDEENEEEEAEYAVGDIVEDDDGLVWELVG
jgi:predicted metal-dependent hydrolase